jgi:hypothetical protein
MYPADQEMHPPKDEIPACVRLTLVLLREHSFIVSLSEVAVFTSGFAFTASVFVRDRAHVGLLDEWSAAWEQPGAVDRGFELVIGYGDGRRQALGPGDAAKGITPIVFHRGWSDEFRVSRTAFAWPLPSRGDVTIDCGWPSQGIARTVSSFPASLLLDAQEAVVRPWDG